MNKLHAVVIAAMSLAPLPGFAAGANITGTVGFRQLDADQWSPTETEAMFGVLADFSFWEAPLHIELGLRGSGDSGNRNGDRLKQSVGDFSAGIAVIPDYGYMRPYVSFGLAAVEVENKLNGNSESDSSAGWYVGGGVLWRMAPNFDVGVDARYLGGTSVFNGFDVDSYTIAARVGWGWDLHRRRYEDEAPPPRRHPRRY